LFEGFAGIGFKSAIAAGNGPTHFECNGPRILKHRRITDQASRIRRLQRPPHAGRQHGWRAKMHDISHRGIHFSLEKLPPGTRVIAGVLLMGGGVLGFLPILGFWMFPLGVLVAALDIPPLRRRLLEKFPKDAADETDQKHGRVPPGA
jgi:hypothetical protein